VPYIIKGDIEVGGASGPVLTIAPGTTIKLQSGVELYCGYNNPGAFVAAGTSGRILFTSWRESPSPGDWRDIGFYGMTGAQTALKHCLIEYGGGSNGNIYIRSTDKPDIANDSIGHSADWGIYLEGSTYPDTIAMRLTNYFYSNASGDIRRP